MGKYLFPEDLFYDPDTHLWVRPVEEHARIGLDMLGAEAMGDLVYVQLEAPGKELRRGEPLGSVEAAKMVTSLRSPISGVVLRRNEEVLQNPARVNEDPYGEGWLVEIRPTHWAEETRILIHGGAVAEWAEREILRYREQGWIGG